MSVKTFHIPIQMFTGTEVHALFFDDAAPYVKQYGDGGACTGMKIHRGSFHVEMRFRMTEDGIGKGRFLAFLVHEVIHAVQLLAQHFNVRDDEFDAYTADFLVAEILKRDPSLRTR